MTALSAPTSPPFHTATAAGEEPIAQTLQRLEGRPGAGGWEPFGSFIAALFTLGLLPLVLWPGRWSEIIENERDDFVALAAWWRGRAAPLEARRMDDALQRLQPWPLLMSVPSIAFWCMTVVFGILVYNNGLDVDLLRGVTYGWDGGASHYASAAMAHLHQLWIGALLVGYGCQWTVVRWHRAAVIAFVGAVNRTAGPSAPLRWQDKIGSGLSPLWVIAAIILCANSAWWGIPFALAGALQRRYTILSPPLRLALAEQARFAMHLAPSIWPGAAYPTGEGQLCRTRGCAARLPGFARFCPRCGASVEQVRGV